MKYDIVYVLRNDIQDNPEELRYSLRSVARNFPYKKVIFAGGCPPGITPDRHIKIRQQGVTKYEKVSNTIRQICSDPAVTSDFWLFNDDFFIMQKTRNMPYYCDGTLERRIREVKARCYGATSKYAFELINTAKVLQASGYDSLNYALHVPMLINKKLALETLEEFPGHHMFRSLYGNRNQVGGVLMPDVKLRVLNEEPDPDAALLSTDDLTFQKGRAGEYIRKQFTEPSRWEIQDSTS